MLVEGLADSCSAVIMNTSDTSNGSTNGQPAATLVVVSSGHESEKPLEYERSGILSSTVHEAVPYGQEAPDTKEGIEELCPVCGDKVSGYHYGLLTCESCKGFFKRTVQNKKVYTCVADRNCHIDKSQRKRCPFCRFQKCLDVGMKLEAVRADRMRGGRNKFGPMYKRDRARKLQLLRQKQLVQAQCQNTGNSEVAALCNTASVVTTSASYYLPSHGASVSSPGLYSPEPPVSSAHIKQEIQIPQLSSSTSSPDSSPSPLAGLVGAPPLAMPPSAPQHYQQVHPVNTSPPDPGKGSLWVVPVPAAPAAPAPPSPPKSFHQYDAPNMAGPPTAPMPLVNVSGKVPALVREFQMTMTDDKEWQNQLFGLLQSQTYNQCEVDLFELMCKVIDQALFAQVDWARNTVFFKELRVDDQMKLLQHSWSDMLLLDHLHQRLHNGLPDETTLPNGQKFDLVSLALLGLPSLADQLHHVAARLQDLRFDSIDYICLKFILLLSPEVRGLGNVKLVHDAQEQTKQVLMEYSVDCYPQIDKFGQLLSVLADLRLVSSRGEEYLYYKHISGSAPTQTLLMEMLHAKKK